MKANENYGGGTASAVLMIAFPVLIFLYFYKTNPGFFREKRKKIQDVYMEEFMEPMLRDWYPDVTVDEKDLRIQNCSAWHQRTGKNRKGIYVRNFRRRFKED